MNQISRFTHVEGVAVYAVLDGKAESDPSAIDVSLSLPEITFETADVPYMGTLTVVDQTRIGNVEVGVSCDVENPNSQKLFGAGLREWKCVWVESVVNPSGALDVIGYTVNCKGFVTSIPEGQKEVGNQANADFKMNCVSIKKQDSNNKIYYDIDRSQSRLVVNGSDLRANVNKLLEG